MSLPSWILCGLPEEVSIIAEPARTAKKAMPPAAPNTIVRVDLTNFSGLVERQPKTVQ